MAVKEMKRVEVGRGEFGAHFFEYIELSSGVSDIYLLPIGAIYAIGVELNGCRIHLTIDDEEMIRDSTSSYILWDGVSEINKAITAFYVEWLSGSANASVTIKVERV
jgi:hypothetical protein